MLLKTDINPRPCKKRCEEEYASSILESSDADGSLSTSSGTPVFEDESVEIRKYIDLARNAQRVLEACDQKKVDAVIKAVTYACCRPGVAEKIARQAIDETKLGSYSGKFAKMSVKTRAALLDIIDDVSVGVIETDEEKQLIKISKPVGVIGATSPSTNPEATPVIKAINALKARNAIIIAPHPRAEKTNTMICEEIRRALAKIGLPKDLVIGIKGASKLKTSELMQQCDLVWATGGAGIVRSAYSSGKPALGVGIGNAVIVVDDSADTEFAAINIKRSKTFDLAASCSADNSVVAFSSVYNKLVENLKQQGGHVATKAEELAISKVLWKENGALNPDAVVQTPQTIGNMAGLSIPSGVEFIIVPSVGFGPDHPFSGEKLSPVLALYKVDCIEEAISLTNNIQEYQGKGHSCGIYSKNDANIMAYAQGTRTSRVLVNQPQSLSNSGSLGNGLAQTLSLGCGTWGGNSVTNNINWRNLVNVTYVSKPLPIPKTIPHDTDLFGQDIMDMF